MFTATLFVIAKIWKPKYPSTDELIKCVIFIDSNIIQP
jgi:hypothetical protein